MTDAWLKPQYPGDAVRMRLFVRGDEIGDVRIQDYGQDRYRVGTFLPGMPVFLPGDTPKVEPELSRWVYSKADADAVFDTYAAKAVLCDGWSPK